MGGAEQVGASSCRSRRETGAASSQEVGGCSAGMSPVVVADGWESQRADGFTESLPVHGHNLLTGSDLGTASSGPVMRTITFTADDRQALAHDRYHHPDPRVQRKMEVLWLKSQGLPHDQIAAYADVSRRSVQRYLDKYLEGGLPHRRRCRWPHPQNALAEHESSLEEYFLWSFTGVVPLSQGM